MTLSEALRKGHKKLQRGSGKYPVTLIIPESANSDHLVPYVTLEALSADDWEPVPEPKKKLKAWVASAVFNNEVYFTVFSDTPPSEDGWIRASWLDEPEDT
jgi:hypothetical protein